MFRNLTIALVASCLLVAPVLAQNNTLSGGSSKPMPPAASQSDSEKSEAGEKKAEKTESKDEKSEKTAEQEEPRTGKSAKNYHHRPRHTAVGHHHHHATRSPRTPHAYGRARRAH